MNSPRIARLLAYYLPQFHPIRENDEWWGKGFTEWTNVAKAKPLFRGHYQPRLPADLGFYDLRLPEVREAQADLARDAGIEGFCYYHYWFGNGKRLLERPLDEVIESGSPDFPFCLCWANESWTGVWFGDDRSLIKQEYGGRKDIESHFDVLIRAFSDPRYITVNGKPLFQILRPGNLPDEREMTDTLRELAARAGLPGLYLVAGYRAHEGWDPRPSGFDAVVSSHFSKGLGTKPGLSLTRLIDRALHTKLLSDNEFLQKALKRYYRVLEYRKLVAAMKLDHHHEWPTFPTAVPNWDNTPRSGVRGYVVTDSTPERFRIHLKEQVDYVQHLPAEERFVFIKSWNEWAEGNYLEPDNKFGDQYLKAVRQCVESDE